MPTHSHNIVDMDRFFIIDPETRAISVPEGYRKTKLVQYDHDSERYTFEIPRYVEGHDMSVSTMIQIHYLNISEDKLKKNADVYQVSDIQVVDEEFVNFSWLISRNATQLAGLLSWAISFTCVENDVEIYKWNTTIYPGVEIAESLSNGNLIVEQYSDLLNEWYSRLFGLGDTLEQRLIDASLEQQRAIEQKGEETLANIPGDLTALQADINGVKEDLAKTDSRLSESITDLERESDSYEIRIRDLEDGGNGLKEKIKIGEGNPVPVDVSDTTEIIIESESATEIMHTGLNLFDLYTLFGGAKTIDLGSGLTMTVNQDSTATISGTCTESKWVSSPIYKVAESDSPWFPAGKYCLTGVIDDYMSCGVVFGIKTASGNSDNSIRKDFSVTEPWKIVFAKIDWYATENKTVNKTIGLALYSGESDLNSPAYSGEKLIGSGRFTATAYADGNVFFTKEANLSCFVIKTISFDNFVKTDTKQIFTEEQKETARNNIGALSKSDIESWYKGKKIATFGDSITNMNYWQPFMAEYLGCTYTRHGVGGCTVAKNTSSGHVNTSMYMDSRINELESDADVILVFGGHNDLAYPITIGNLEDNYETLDQFSKKLVLNDDGPVDTFEYAYALMLKKLITRFPNAKIFTMSCIGGRHDARYPDRDDGHFFWMEYNMEDYANSVKKISAYFGIPCIDLSSLSGINTLNWRTYLSDDIHPNEAGGKLMAARIVRELLRFEPIVYASNWRDIMNKYEVTSM